MIDAVRGCLKEEMRMDTISANLANVSVIGFKKERISFQDLLEEAQVSGPGPEGLTGEPSDPALIRVQTDHSQGDSRITGNTLDFAIFGRGFFKIETPEGIRYTRRGNFVLDGEGNLVTQEGNKVLGAGGPIYIDEGNIHVDELGVVSVDGSPSGQIELVDFGNYDGLVKAGNGLFRQATDALEVPPPRETRIEQGYVELSNVNIVEEMVGMIHSLRAFESYQKSIQVIDGLNQRAVNEVGRLR